LNIESNMKRLGIIAAPGWFDPTAGEFLRSHVGEVEVTQTIMGPPGFDWSFASIQSSELHLRDAAQLLAEAGCECIAQVGPAFAYQAGGGTVTGAHALGRRLSDAAGVPVILNGCAVLESLDALGIRSFTALCPYYNPEWKHQFCKFMAGAGFVIQGAKTFVDLEIITTQADVDARRYHFAEEEVLRALYVNLAQSLGTQALVISGSGVRTLAWLHRVQAEINLPIVSADGALYSAVCRALQLPERLGNAIEIV
jgi:maleate cis-trans isomerase